MARKHRKSRRSKVSSRRVTKRKSSKRSRAGRKAWRTRMAKRAARRASAKRSHRRHSVRRVRRARVVRVRHGKRRRSALVIRVTNPRRRRRHNVVHRRRYYSRRRWSNPMPSMSGIVGQFKALVSKSALKDYGFVGLGFVAGNILPGLITRGLARFGIVSDSAPVRYGVGALGAALAGVITGIVTKDRNKATLAAAGGVVGVFGQMVLDRVSSLLPSLPMSGLGADGDIRSAVDAEIKRQLGVGEYINEGALAGGIGEYVTDGSVESAPTVAGMGMEASDDIDEVDTFDGGDF